MITTRQGLSNGDTVMSSDKHVPAAQISIAAWYSSPSNISGAEIMRVTTSGDERNVNSIRLGQTIIYQDADDTNLDTTE